MSRLIGLLGGTFNPIHHGHIRFALEVHERLNLDQVRLIPLNTPSHRVAPIASVACRVDMIKLAINDIPALYLDLCEIEMKGVSYTINTLKSLRLKFSCDALYLLIGRDAFNKLGHWKEWPSLLDYAHIIVANRPGISASISPMLKDWVEQYQTTDRNLLKNNLNGYLYFIEPPMLDISSNRIRSLVSQQKNINGLLNEKICSYIEKTRLYRNIPILPES